MQFRSSSRGTLHHLAARTNPHREPVSYYCENTIGADSLIAASNELESIDRMLLRSSRLTCEISRMPRHDEG